MTGFVSIHGSRFGISRDTPTKLVVDGAEVKVAGVATIGALTVLTDNSGGTADNTVAAIPAATAATTDTSAASLTSVNTALTAIKNDIADLTAKLNAVINAVK